MSSLNSERQPQEPATPAHVLREWHEESSRLGGRDTMLHFRESRDGSIDLSGAHPSGLAQLLAGRATRLSSLVRDQESLADARRRAKSIRAKAEQLQTERALEAAHLAIGIATWGGDRSLGQPEVNGPVLLRHVTLAPRGQRVEDFEVRLSDDVVVNPALVRYLREEHGLTVPEADWVALTRRTHGFDAAPVLDQLRLLTKPIPGFLVSNKLVVSTFADISGVFASDPLPDSHPLLLALAGDERARSLYSTEEAPGAVEDQNRLSSPDGQSSPDGRDEAEPRTEAEAFNQQAAIVPAPGPPASSAAADDTSPDSGVDADHAEPGGTDAADANVAGATPADGRSPAAAPIGDVATPDAPGNADTNVSADAAAKGDDSDEGADLLAPTGPTSPDAARGGTAGTESPDDTSDSPAPRATASPDAADDKPKTGVKEMRPGVAPQAEDDELEDDLPTPSELPRPLRDSDPSQEFLVLDVDGDQQAVIDDALEGQNLVVDTPPGTGATQLAVALTAALTFAGRRVLFVAQSADALDDFADRMAEAGLAGLAIDGRADAAQRRTALIGRITSNERAPRPDISPVFSHLYDLRSQLSSHTEALHRVRKPWGVSAFTTMEHLARLTAEEESPQTTVRLPQALLTSSPEDLAELRRRLEYVGTLGAFRLDVEDTVWFGARLSSDREAEAARSTAEKAGAKTLPHLSSMMVPLLREAELNPSRTVGGWGQALDVLMRIRRSLDSFSSDIYELNLDEMIAATGNADYRSKQGADMGMLARNRLKKLAREYVRPGAQVEDMHASLVEVRDQRAAWRSVSRHGEAPKLPRGLVDAHKVYQDLSGDLEKLSPVLATTPAGGDLFDMDTEDLSARLLALGSDRDALNDLPERTAVDSELRARGLGGLLDDMRGRKVSEAMIGQEFDLSWWASVLQAMAAEDPAVGGHDGEEMHRVAAEFRLADRRHIDLGSYRLLHELGRRWKDVIAAQPDQAEALKAALRSESGDLRELTALAPDVTGTLAPVWLASPLQVPALVTAGGFFDTVIIADAGRMSVPEVLPALARSTQVVALGDDRLLGPGEFSVGVDRRRDPGGDPDGPRSIFAELSAFLPSRRLHYSYRTSPVGLISLANRHFYGNAISTLPQATTGAGSGIEFAYIAKGVGATDSSTGLVESTDAEVDHVVQMVMRHARTRSRQSLAVITLSAIHAHRVAVAIGRAIRDYPYVAAFFSDRTKEPFVVTDTERIRGLSRDFVILSLGYGRTPHGRIMYNLGRLSQPGGERVLATAITRARRHLSVVSCFEADDLDVSRLRGGAVMLPQFLSEVAASSGRSQLLTAREPGRDPLLADISDRLIKSGVMTYENYGGIDLAVANSDGQEHGMVVAVEGDGPAYASVASIRERERLHPERLARRGWRHVRVWSTDAFVDPQSQADMIFDVWRETVEGLSPQSVLDAARAAAEVVRRRGSRPKVALGLPIHAYSDHDFAATLDWILSDGSTRTDADLRELLRSALAIKSRSRQTNERLEAAVAASRERSNQAKQARNGEAAAAGSVEDAGEGSGEDAAAVGGRAPATDSSSGEEREASGDPNSPAGEQVPTAAKDRRSKDGDDAAKQEMKSAQSAAAAQIALAARAASKARDTAAERGTSVEHDDTIADRDNTADRDTTADRDNSEDDASPVAESKAAPVQVQPEKRDDAEAQDGTPAGNMPGDTDSRKSESDAQESTPDTSAPEPASGASRPAEDLGAGEASLPADSGESTVPPASRSERQTDGVSEADISDANAEHEGSRPPTDRAANTDSAAEKHDG